MREPRERRGVVNAVLRRRVGEEGLGVVGDSEASV